MLEDNRDALIRIAEALLEREVLDAKEVTALVEGRDLPPLTDPQTPSPSATETSDPKAEDDQVADGPGGVLPAPGNQPA